MFESIKYCIGVLIILFSYLIFGYMLFDKPLRIVIAISFIVVIFIIIISVIYSIIFLFVRKKANRHLYCILGTIAIIFLSNITQRAMKYQPWGYVYRESGIFLQVPNKHWKEPNDNDEIQLIRKSKFSAGTLSILSLSNDTFENETYDDFINSSKGVPDSTEKYLFTSCQVINFNCMKAESSVLQQGKRFNVKITFLKDNISTIFILAVSDEENKDKYHDDIISMIKSAKRIIPAH